MLIAPARFFTLGTPVALLTHERELQQYEEPGE
jgi:hypothetical protein